MAKSKTPTRGSKITIPKSEQEDIMVPLTTTVSQTLLNRITKARKAFGMSTEQECIRIGMHAYLTMNGF